MLVPSDLDIYLTATRFSKYQSLVTSTSADSCYIGNALKYFFTEIPPLFVMSVVVMLSCHFIIKIVQNKLLCNSFVRKLSLIFIVMFCKYICLSSGSGNNEIHN